MFYWKKTVINNTIPPETIVPNNNKGNDFLAGTAKTNAAKAPVNPPISGMGVAAKINIDQVPYFFIFLSAFFLVCSKSHLKNLSKIEIYLDKILEIGSSKKTIITIAK